jgi:multidrug efflux pump subunit AcrB
MQWAGISINPTSYISLVMSVGLLVDFILHVLLRFYESHGNRKEKVVSMLETMGSSILIGGITTFLGTLPLAFSSSSIFGTIFITFLGLVTLGASHGLILLPVILSLIGPEEHIAGVGIATGGVATTGTHGRKYTSRRYGLVRHGLLYCRQQATRETAKQGQVSRSCWC